MLGHFKEEILRNTERRLQHLATPQHMLSHTWATSDLSTNRDGCPSTHMGHMLARGLNLQQLKATTKSSAMRTVHPDCLSNRLSRKGVGGF